MMKKDLTTKMHLVVIQFQEMRFLALLQSKMALKFTKKIVLIHLAFNQIMIIE